MTLARASQRALSRVLPPRRRAGVVVLLAAMLVVAGGEKAMARMFYLERPRWGAHLDYSFQNSKQSTPSRHSQGTSHRYTEGLKMASRGYLYHPALLVFDLSLEPKWEQQRAKYEPGQASAVSSFFLDYGFDGTLLQRQPVSVQLLARQNTSTTSSSLNPATTSDTSVYGATLVYASRKFPSRLSYTHNEQNQEGFYSSTQSSDTMRLSSSNRAERYHTNLNADWVKRWREAQGPGQASENASFRLTNSLDVTADRRMRLSSALSTNRTEVQDQISSNLALNESLAWQHTDPQKRLQIRSKYTARYTFNSTSYTDGATKRSEDIPLEAGVSLSHLLYENLVSSLDGNIGHHKFEGGHAQSYGGGVNFAYSRRVPVGTISLNLGQNYQVSDRTVTADYMEVTRLAPELLTFDQLGARLANRHVDLDRPVELFRSDGFTYAMLSDYDIVPVGDFVEIRPVMGSVLSDDLGNGERVWASYSYSSDPSARLGTLTRSFGAGLSLWSVLDLRYRLARTEGELLAGTPPDHGLADDTMQSVSAQLTYRWSDTLLTYDDEQRAAGNSMRRWQARQKFSWRPRNNISLSVGGSYGELELLDTGSSGRSYRLDARGQWQPRPNQQWRLEAFQNTSTSNRPDRNESSGLGLFYLKRFGVWNMEVNYRHLLDQQPLAGQERSQDTLNLTLRRVLR